MITTDEYKKIIKDERKKSFDTPYDLTYKVFEYLGYHKKEPDYFIENASEIVENLREGCWNRFQESEKNFTSRMLLKLINKEKIKKMASLEAITYFVENYPKHIYDLNLSNTQSRRSRAGKEFEAIIELLLVGAGIPMDAQGNIGKKIFIEKGLGKLVDLVIPGATEFTINKRYAILVSAKTTLRERWQEVPEEMGRTGASEMFLATLDSTSQQVLDTLYEANITLTTTKNIKKTCYNDNIRVFTFEDLLLSARSNMDRWANYSYSKGELESEIDLIEKQMSNHADHKFVYDYYLKRKEDIIKKLR